MKRRQGRTLYMFKCICGHVAESHRDTGEPWTQECNAGRCGCNAFSSRYEERPDIDEEAE